MSMTAGSNPALEIEGNARVLVETALLGMGLPSLGDDLIRDLWPRSPEVAAVWLDRGRVYAGGIERFLEVRNIPGLARADAMTCAGEAARGGSAFLTASALFPVAVQMGAGVVVTAGMGGVREGRYSRDMDLHRYPVLLVATAPKDSQDAAATIALLRCRKARVMGYRSMFTDGFIFCSRERVSLDQQYAGEGLGELVPGGAGCLLLNPLPGEMRLRDRGWLDLSVAGGVCAEQNGKRFHPAVNSALDKFTGGLASYLQLVALEANIKVALEVLSNTMQP